MQMFCVASVLVLAMSKYVPNALGDNFYHMTLYDRFSPKLVRSKLFYALLVCLSAMIRGFVHLQGKGDSVTSLCYIHSNIVPKEDDFVLKTRNTVLKNWNTVDTVVRFDPMLRDAKLNNTYHMYFPTHTRFGPFVIGIIAALFLLDSRAAVKPAQGRQHPYVGIIAALFEPVMFWALSTLSALTLVFSASPVPLLCNNFSSGVARLLFTACYRNCVGAALAFVLYCCLVHEKHPFASSKARAVLGAKLWYPLAKLSFGVYMYHFRVMFELVFRVFIKLKSPSDIPEHPGVGVACIIAVVTLLVSYGLAILNYICVEAPAASLMKRYMTGSGHQKKP